VTKALLLISAFIFSACSLQQTDISAPTLIGRLISCGCHSSMIGDCPVNSDFVGQTTAAVHQSTGSSDRSNFNYSSPAPLALAVQLISGNQQNAEMLYQDKIYRQTPQKLATQLTGVPLPVNALSWWARGLPSPNQKTASSIATSPDGYASSFEQAGWQLSFSRYSETDAGSLPGKIVGTHQSSDDRRYSFKLVISDWSFAK